VTQKTYTDADLATLTAALPYVEQWLDYRTWSTRTPGVQASVLFDDAVQFSSAFGVADLVTQEPLTTTHLFRIASHSKTFTATAILQLAETGALRLDDPVEQFVPALAESGLAGVTVRELLGHSAGIIRDGLNGDYWQGTRPFPDEAELLEILVDEGKIFERNETFKYTNIGYSLLGLIIAAASGQTYNEYVATEICARLGLANTGPELDPARASEYAAPHTGLQTARERIRVDHVDTRAMAAATGFYSTSDDLVRYFAAHRYGDESLLSDASKRLQQRLEWQTHPEEIAGGHYGLGMIAEKVGDHAIIGHSGGYPGHITRSVLDPHTGLAISVLTNAGDGPASELVLGVLRILDFATAQPLGENAIDGSAFVGRFANMWGVMDVAQLGNRLVALHPGQASPVAAFDELEISDDDTLVFSAGSGYGSIGEKLVYTRAADGSIEKIQGGGGMTMWPIEAYREREASRE
jgi:CubicO group peptidase (beta-lactamase class C family)